MARRGWGCAKTFATRRVPVVSLATVVGRWLRRLPNVSYVKIDAQGYDLKVAESAGAVADRIGMLRLEMTRDASQLPNEGAIGCAEAVAGMRALGFTTRTSCAYRGPADHHDFIFRRAAAARPRGTATA